MKKYEEGLNDEQLDEQIKKVGSLIPKEDENSKYQLVIVEGHIFEIDRSVPKIVNYKGPADGIIITASITQNGNWQNPVATVTGTITKYGGGTVTSSSATSTNGVTISGFPTTGGSYTISNITEDTDITITAQDSEGHEPVTEVIKVRLIRDNTPPTLSNAKAEATLMKIKISVNAVDSESGVERINYTVSPATVKNEKGEAAGTGTISSGQVIELTAETEGEYTVTFTAIDKAGNSDTATAGPVRVTDAISIADLKKDINAENYPDYIGTKVDYNPEAGGIWRVFYYDADGYFGDGAGTIYLKRDCDTSGKSIYGYKGHNPADGGVLMNQLNPQWATASDGTTLNFGNVRCAMALCDSNEWTTYKTSEAKYAIGAPSIEMWTKAYNAYVTKYEPSDNKVNCGMPNVNGYGWGLNEGSLSKSNNISIDKSIPQSTVIATDKIQWLASPCYLDGYKTESQRNVCRKSIGGIQPPKL